MIHQGLPPLRADGDRFDDDRSLREEDCVIPEDQEQQLEEQDDWGLPTTTGPQPTDSELIEENGHVPMPESQVVQGNAQSTQDSLASSGDLSVVLSAHSSTSSVTLPGNPSVTLSGEVSVDSTLDSPKFHFQQENIRETFVVGSDLESDTEDEDNGEQEAKDAKASTLKSQRRASSSTPVRSSPAPTMPKPLQSSCMIVDLTDDSPGKAPPAVLTSATKAMQAVEPKTDAEASQQAAIDSAADRAFSQTPQKSHQTPETPSRQTGWGTIFRKLASNLVGLGTPSAEDSHPDAHRSDEEFNESAEDDQQATQLLNQPESEKEVTESKEDEPEEFISSQATVVLEYAIDNDEDANAFEYEGMISDDMASPRSTASRRTDRITSEVHSPAADASNSVDDDLTLTEDYVDVTVTPQKQSPPKEATPDLKTPSSSKQTLKPGTEMRTNTRQALSVTSHSPAHSNDSSRGGNPLTSTNPVPRTDESAKLSPAKSPSNLVISVGSNLSQAKRSEPSTTGPRASKRKREHTSPEDPSPETTNADLVQENAVIVSPPQPQSDAQQREQAQKRRRREILPSFEGGSQSPQFEQPSSPFVSRRKTQSDRTTIIADSYSLDAVCRSLGSHVRDQANEEDQARSARQPRRAWKRYERLFPPLNMTRLKQMMAEDKSK
ncbi:hypothetical protein ON010_g10751 [Phytophthora cinnamomi]|nr:hypothetical protein ON010_g10751 [Phytophthora cinnamomi]